MEFLEALDSSTKAEAEKIAASIYMPLIDALRKAKKVDDIDARVKQVLIALMERSQQSVVVAVARLRRGGRQRSF